MKQAPPKAQPLFSDGLKQSPLQLGRRKINDMGCGSPGRGREMLRITSLRMELVSYARSTRPSSLSPEMRCLFRPQTAPPRQMPSLLVFHLPPPSLTILIYSKGCYPNKPSHTSYHSSLLKLLHPNSRLLQPTPAKMTLLFSPKE